MIHRIRSLYEQNIKVKENFVISFQEILRTENRWAICDMFTSFEFDDRILNSITIIHVDANGNEFKNDFTLPDGRTYWVVLNRIRPYFETK